MIDETIFSVCRDYRYTLVRIFDEERFRKEGACTFICLNPSTADEVNNDSTVRRCINYAKEWGYAAFIMLNVFAYRATYPDVMKAQFEPVGMENNKFILDVCKESALVVAAWGNHGMHMNRCEDVEQLLTWKGIQLHCLKINSATRIPAHPLYLKKSLKPILLSEARRRP